jgi:hypothetical protein
MAAPVPAALGGALVPATAELGGAAVPAAPTEVGAPSGTGSLGVVCTAGRLVAPAAVLLIAPALPLTAAVPWAAGALTAPATGAIVALLEVVGCWVGDCEQATLKATSAYESPLCILGSQYSVLLLCLMLPALTPMNRSSPILL